MKNKYVLLLIISMCFLCTVNDSLFSRPLSTFYSSSDSIKKYRILKIKSNKGLYTIYAERNDTVFKVVSKKQKVDCSNYEKIQCKREYSLLLQSLFPRSFHGIKLPPPGATGRMGTIYYGVDVSLEIENGIWDIYEATNLKGLYIEEEDIPSN